ncbi:hypothetical protein Mp_1g26900 [Marchantia polymorpha subsp. ruderalis]|uniref:Uncharacterized protein n=2 Tax=Marchantia polymorpha TaxID=3197 RepID=A0AAF6AUP3_MARPO|nr:hypothetical protein MARPO_0002s0188 [Marchantia polymorpha]PTQ49721.1 hypothetical protein MARPO_0002s0188 [Marchantia polymorpha]BBN00163.1 hypothetical protein Mp_1g26900 [Marchantia polymorpha subsp. ruderalis]BBN00164.1 hypothetical protein Mp_1g26900 [Marchantia polymorpha subsp. ruderalis]|eukprot:PTQ49720.1 hypothetical protein MARPO_0002s0188 [Marchantia polymorpha]
MTLRLFQKPNQSLTNVDAALNSRRLRRLGNRYTAALHTLRKLTAYRVPKAMMKAGSVEFRAAGLVPFLLSQSTVSGISPRNLNREWRRGHRLARVGGGM